MHTTSRASLVAFMLMAGWAKAAPPAISVNSPSGPAGGTADVVVSFSNSTDTTPRSAGLQFLLTYDASKLTPISFASSLSGTICGPVATGVVSCGGFAPTGSFSDAGTFTIPMTISSEAVGTAFLALSDHQQFDELGNDIAGINADPPDGILTIGGGTTNFSYTYWNPDEPGWGYNLQHQGDLLYGTWYTYADDGQVMFLTVEATAQSVSSFAGPVYRIAGTPFNLINGNQAFTSVTQVGTAQMSFAADGRLALSYTVNGATQVKALEKFIFGSTAPACVGTIDSRSGATNYSDLWWNATEPGWGLTLAHQGDTVFALWYTYGSAGRDQWISASSLIRQPDGSYTGALQRPLSGTPLAQIAGPATSFPVPGVGSATLRFTNGETGTFSYTLDGVSQTKPIQRFVVVGEDQAKPLCAE